MKIRLCDVFWLILIIGLACALWRERSRTQVFARELNYYRSAAPPIELIETPLGDAIGLLESGHGVKIEVDWPSIDKVLHWDPKTPVTHMLYDGSLTAAIERIFEGQAVVEGTDRGLCIRGRDPARDGPPKKWWAHRASDKAFQALIEAPRP